LLSRAKSRRTEVNISIFVYVPICLSFYICMYYVVIWSFYHKISSFIITSLFDMSLLMFMFMFVKFFCYCSFKV
jgi:hypothetical protein